jgi:hypothetical protein
LARKNPIKIKFEKKILQTKKITIKKIRTKFEKLKNYRDEIKNYL